MKVYFHYQTQNQNQYIYSNYVNSLIILPNSNIVSASKDFNIIIWNSITFKQITTLTGHSNDVKSLAFLSNTQIFSGSSDYSTKSWTYCELCYLNDLSGHTDSVNDLKFLKSSKLDESYTFTIMS